MKVSSRAVVGAGGALRVLDSAAPLTLRRVRSDDPRTCALCLVGTAAGPLPGDELSLALTIEDGARAELQATGASIAQGGGDPGGGDQGRGEQGSESGDRSARIRVDAHVGTDAELTADPGPLIVCDGSRVDVSLRIDLASGAAVRWLETVVLGRSYDTGTGRATIRWDVTRGGRPVLRQLVDLADPLLRAWPGHVGGSRVVASAFVTGPDVDARTVVGDPGLARYAVVQQVDEHSALVTVLADEAHQAVARRETMLARLESRPRSAAAR